jgi:hypothetical protein
MEIHGTKVDASKLAPDDPFFGLIERAYEVFAYLKPTSTEVCVRCCMNREIEDDFFNPPIRELPLSYVQDWYSAAYEPPGIAKATWAYLLPRILEILAAGEDVSAVGIEVSLSRFDTGNARNWSKEEWEILDRFQRDFLRRQAEQGRDNLDDVVCMFRLAGWPLTDLLEQVASMPTPLLAQRFWHDWCAGCVPGREGVWITAFWEGSDPSTAFDFYTSPSLYDRMVSLGAAKDIDEELAAKASAVARVIEANADWL